VIERELRFLGINNNSKIIIYNHNTNKGLSKSTLLAFIILYSGHDNVQILDGGYMEWVFENQILTSLNLPKDKKSGNFKIKPRKNLLADIEYIKNLSSRIKLFDARSPDEYYGITKSHDINQLGHIAHASSSYYKYKFNSDMTVRNMDDLNEIYFQGYTLSSYDGAVVYSDNIFNASIEWYLLYKHMGFQNTKLYQRSLLEWGNDSKNNLVRFKWE
jgi:thiosulfate/3-mercaptopyruvate sulfurtransferase